MRLLHHCLVSQKEMETFVAEAAAPTRGLLNTCTALLVSPISSVYSPTIEAVLQKLGLHSGELGLALIDNILRSNSPVSDNGEWKNIYMRTIQWFIFMMHFSISVVWDVVIAFQKLF